LNETAAGPLRIAQETPVDTDSPAIGRERVVWTGSIR
jgi:hypothetical protein